MFHEEQTLLQCFVSGIKAGASQRRRLPFDVTRHVPKLTNMSVWLETNAATKK